MVWKRKRRRRSYHELDNVQRRLVRLEGGDAEVEAASESGNARQPAVGRQVTGDVAGAAVKSYRPPHNSEGAADADRDALRVA